MKRPFRRRQPKPAAASTPVSALGGRLAASPGVWFEWPADVALYLERDSFLIYDVMGEPDGTVWIRQKRHA